MITFRTVKTLVSTLVLAGTLSMPLAAQTFDWSGFRLGLHMGQARDHVIWGERGLGGRSIPGDWRRGPAGLSLGYDRQIGRTVYGGVLDFGGSGTNAMATTSPDFDCGTGCETELRRYMTLRGRIGHAAGRALFYATAGAASAQVRASSGGTVLAQDSRTGWAAGLGAEFAVTPRMVLQVEYLYTDLGRTEIGAPCGTDCFTNINFNTLRFGLHYRLGGTVPARASATPGHDWSGPYAGIGATVLPLSRNRHEAGGGAVGSLARHWNGIGPRLALGYNWQRGRLVAGLEADLGLGAIRSVSFSDPGVFDCGPSGRCTTRVSQNMGLTARLGYARGDFLYFVGAGASSARVAAGTADLGTVASGRRVGYSAGLGLEYALDRRTRVVVEYRGHRLGRLPIAACGADCGTSVNYFELLFGVNYRW